MLDDRPTASSAWEDALVWPPSANRIGWQAYLGALAHTTPPAYAAAARADDLTGLPPAFVLVGSVEIFLDESLDYARRLIHAGVPTDLHVHAGAPHGFETMAPGAAVTRRAFRALEDWLDPKLE
jgi:acetyl esterase/lipase